MPYTYTYILILLLLLIPILILLLILLLILILLLFYLSLHLIQFPAVYVLLLLMWLFIGTPLGIIGYWLGSQSRPLFTLIDRRVIWAASFIAVILTILGKAPILIIVIGAIGAQHAMANKLVVCKERRIVVTPWHISSQGMYLDCVSMMDGCAN